MSGYQDVPMTRRRAQLLEEYASKLADMLEAAPNDKDLAEWVQSKVDRAAAAIQSAYHYLDQDDESDDLEKARTKKYDYRRPSKRINKKTGKREWDYFYTKKHGARVIRGAFEAGAAFRMTWRGRKGHFHIHHVKGDQVFITHDSRPDMEPVPVQADELRALLGRQHKREVDQHLKRKTREVEEIKRRAHRGGLGLALHRLRQAAAQAGVSLPEQYQSKPKKTRAKVAETAQAPKTKRGHFTPSEMEEMERYESYLFGETEDRTAYLKQLDLSEIEAKINKVQAFYDDLRESNPVVYRKRNKHKSYRELQDLKRYVRTRKAEGRLKGEAPATETPDPKPLQVKEQTPEERKAGQQAFEQLFGYSLEQTTPRDQLTSTAQQIIEDANQEHAERHDEHQEITRFELGEHVHTKTGAKLYTAKQTERVERDEYFRRLEIAKRHGGRYERRYVRGFVFKTAEDARAFALEVEGAAQEAPETSAETVTPHDEHPGADNFETMPEVESAPTQRLRGVLDALSESERLNTINPKNRKRPKEAKGADAKLIKLINELAEDQDPNERRFLKVMASMLQDVKKQYPRSAYERRESRKDRYATIREFIEKKLGVEPTATAPNLGEILSRPTTPSTRPTNLHSRSIKGTVDQALSSEPTGISLTDARFVIPSKGDLREMLSQEQRLKRAKEDLVSTGAPNFLGQKDPIRDITYALSRYLDGPYVELGQGRIREMERQFKISLRDARGEDLEQTKDEIARFWREWGGEYKRLQDEFARGRTQGEALRNIRPLIPKHALTPEINQQLDQMERELDQRPVTGHDVARWIDTRDTNEATRDRQPTTPREQLTATAREVTQGADNFETMPEVESARATTATVRDVQSTLKASRRADKLTSTGRRARASINADKELIEAAQRALDEGYKGMESPAFIPLNERTPRQANYQRLKGALNGFKSSQTLTRGSWTDDHKSLQKKRIKARDQLDEALKELDQIARSQEQAQVSIEDLPPKGQRTLEDAKRFFGEPRYFERIEGSKTKRYVIYERDGHRIVGPASGRGKGKFSRSFSWDTPRYRREREQGNIIAGPDSLTYQEIGDYDTLDEALTRTVNQYRSQDEMIDKLIEKEKERLAQGRKELERLSATPREQLTATAREVTQGADNFETISDEHKEFIQNKTREFSRELMHGLINEKTKRGKIKSLQRQGTGDMERALVKLALSALRGKEVTNSSVKQFIASKITGERAEGTQGRLSALLSVGDTVEDKQDILYKQALIEAADHIDEIAQGLSVHDKDFSDTEHRAVKQRTAYLRALSAEIETGQPTPAPSPARQALTETAERVTSDQTAEQATTRATPRPSEATLRGSGELDETVRANLQDRAQFLLSTPENVTKTGMRSKAQKARDGELLLIHRRLQSDAQERLGPTAPRLADYSQLIGMPRADQPENAETRAQFRAALKDAIRELEQATSGRAESVQGLDAYRALEGTFIGHLEEHLKTVSDQDLRAMRGAIDAEVARVEELTKDEKKRRDDTSAALDKIAEERAAITRKIEALKPRRDKALDRKESRLNRAYDDQWSEARRARIAYIEKRRENRDPLVDKLSKPLKREENRRARRVQKSARPLITYRAQLIQTVERLTAA